MWVLSCSLSGTSSSNSATYSRRALRSIPPSRHPVSRYEKDLKTSHTTGRYEARVDVRHGGPWGDYQHVASEIFLGGLGGDRPAFNARSTGPREDSCSALRTRVRGAIGAALGDHPSGGVPWAARKWRRSRMAGRECSVGLAALGGCTPPSAGP